MAPAIQRDLCESHRGRLDRLRPQKIEKESTRRILVPETAMVSMVQEEEEQSSRDSVPVKFESAGVHLTRCLRSDRGFQRNKRMPLGECRTSECRARLFATKVPVPDTGNRISQRKRIPGVYPYN